MGLGYYHPVTQWSKGEYAGANNKQDDIAVIKSKLGSAISSGGSSLSTAAPLAIAPAMATAKTATATASGVLATSDAVAYYSFTTTAPGMVEVVVSGGSHAVGGENQGNLNPLLKVYNEQGVVLAIGLGKLPSKENISGHPSSAGFALGDIITLNLPAGVYKVSVEPKGMNDPLYSGYTSYGSLGQYILTVNVPYDETAAGHSSPPPPPPVPTGSLGVQRPPTPPPPPGLPPKGRKVAQSRKMLVKGATSATARVMVADAASAVPIANALVVIKWEIQGALSNGVGRKVIGFPYYSSLKTNSQGFARVISNAITDPQVLDRVGFSVVSVVSQGVQWQLRGAAKAKGNDQVQVLPQEQGQQSPLKQSAAAAAAAAESAASDIDMSNSGSRKLLRGW
jgi:hypothetical protein